MEVYGSAVAAHVLDYAGSRSFDSRTTPNSWENFGSPVVSSSSLITDSTQFDLPSSFGSSPDCNLYKPYNDSIICDDLGDLHMGADDWQPYKYVVEVVNKDTLSIPFEVNTQVSYVNIAFPDSTLPASVRTNTKKVTVRVRSVQHHLENSSRGQVTIERMYTYDGDVAFEQHKASVLVCDGGGNELHVNRLLVPIYENQGGTAGPC